MFHQRVSSVSIAQDVTNPVISPARQASQCQPHNVFHHPVIIAQIPSAIHRKPPQAVCERQGTEAGGDGQFLESYAQLMELNTWSSATLKRANWDGSSWEVTIERRSEGGIEVRTLRTRHIIQATGVNGEPKIPRIEGLGDFRGPICHSSQFSSAEPATPAKQIVVVGTGVSGHDIAQDFYERGHRVTLFQRSPTCVDRTAYVYGQGLYSEDGPATEDADFLTHSVPLPLLKRREIEKTEQHMLENKEHFEGLEKAGFRLKEVWGIDEEGELRSIWRRSGHPGYWLAGGNFALCRYYSRMLALQIKAIEEGIMR
ncbi:hypothetical protein B0T21DRAFT_407937 [Apiosordaria backusii]|uniref:Uncharacterized protein n=1 Tax=Apiosordaria backusii TaxID=314023 RepID=A0AA40EST0_9PEZI|nr:hypothetical protein B0T21DRAFT_407937 [Apiosordaria backusii]